MIFITLILLVIIFIEIYQYYSNTAEIKKIFDKTTKIQKMSIINLNDFKQYTIDKNVSMDLKAGEIYTNDEDSNVFIETDDDLILVRKNILYTVYKNFKLEVNLTNLKEKYNFYYKVKL